MNLNKIFLIVLLLISNGGSSSLLKPSEDTEVKPLLLTCSHKTLQTFSLLGSIHTLEFSSLDKKAQQHLLGYDRCIGETETTEKPFTTKDYVELWGYRENDNDFQIFKKSSTFNKLRPEEKELFNELSLHNLSFAHTYYLFKIDLLDEEYRLGIDETLEEIYKEKSENACHYLLTASETLKSLKFWKYMSYEELVEEDESDDELIYPETLEEAIASLAAEKVDKLHEENFRMRDKLFVDRLLEILAEKKLNNLFVVGVNHLPGMVKSLEEKGVKISQVKF